MKTNEQIYSKLLELERKLNRVINEKGDILPEDIFANELRNNEIAHLFRPCVEYPSIDDLIQVSQVKRICQSVQRSGLA